MPIRSLLIWGVVALVLVVAFAAMQGGNNAARGAQELAYSQLLDRVENGAISSVTTQGEMLLSEARDGKHYVTYLPTGTMANVVERLEAGNVQVNTKAPARGPSFGDILLGILPMLLPETATDPDMAMIVTQPLVAGLRVAYAVDSERTISYVSQPALERWQLTLDEIHQVALDNLVARSDAINAHAAQDESGQIYLILFQTLDGYDASRLLLPTLNERLREHLGSPFAAGVPNRSTWTL